MELEYMQLTILWCILAKQKAVHEARKEQR